MNEMVKGNSQQDQAPLLLHLPTVILTLIMKCSVNSTSLWSLINTSSRLSFIFMTTAKGIVGYIITQTTPTCVRNFMKIVLVTRTLPDSLLHIKDIKYMSEETILKTFQQEISSRVLCNFVELMHIIHSVAHACLDFCIEKTKTMQPRRLTDSELVRIRKLQSSQRQTYHEPLEQPFQPRHSGPPS